jgi:putative transposase
MTPTGKYFASFSCEQEYQQYKPTGSEIGIDVGVKDLAVLSDGKKYRNTKPLKAFLKELKFEQRKLSKKVNGSSSRKKQQVKVSRIHEKIGNTRHDVLHKVTTEIVKNHDVICIEDLAVINMMKNHKLAQVLSDASIGTFFRMLNYKAEWNDKTIVKIDRFYPSSKNCHVCDTLKKDLTLKDRTWICLSCGTEHDRDINAALNILDQGLKILSGFGTNPDVKQKQVEPPKKYFLRKSFGFCRETGAKKPEITAL